MNLRVGHSQFYVVSMMMIMLGSAGIFYAGYWLGQDNSPQYGPDGKRINTASNHRKKFAKIKKMTQTSLRRFSLHVGYLKAGVIRLNESGTRIIKLSNGKMKDFDFSVNPGIGGIEKPDYKLVNSKDLTDDINRLSRIVKDRELKLTMLETLLINANLRRNAKPEGRPVRKRDGWVKMTSRFGSRRDPFTRRHKFHDGIDYAARSGTPIYTVAAGIVTASGWRGGYGKTVEVSHGKGLVSRYAHNRKLLVKVGDKIRKGQKIAEMGSTGRSTGPHVHYEILENGKPISPHQFMVKKSTSK